MDTFDKIEAILAELLEQANDQKKNSGKLSSKLDGIDSRLSNLEAVSASPQVTESVITLVDHDKKMLREVQEFVWKTSRWATLLGYKRMAHQGIPLDSWQTSPMDMDYLYPVYLDSLAVNL